MNNSVTNADAQFLKIEREFLTIGFRSFFTMERGFAVFANAREYLTIENQYLTIEEHEYQGYIGQWSLLCNS